MTLRDKKQAEVIQLYKDKNPHRCTLVLSTGFGKGKVAIDLIKWLNPPNVIILVNSDDLRDTMWRNEFTEWGMPEYYQNKVTMVNYQTAYKWTETTNAQHWYSDTLVIADEVDFAGGTEKFSRFFHAFPTHRTIGLTGFITKTKQPWFDEFLPVLVKYDADDAQGDGVLNKMNFVFIKYDLSRDPKDIKITYKKGGVEKSFTNSQCNAYDYNEKKFDKFKTQKEQLNIASLSGTMNASNYQKQIKHIDFQEKMAVKARSEILLHNKASVVIVRNLLNFILSDEDNKVVVFSKRTEQSTAIVGDDYVYHGGISKTKAAENYLKFMSGSSRLLGVCDKINRGVNIPNLNVGIFESFYGSDTKATQRFGRLMRLEADKTATIYMLLPYYMRKERDGTYTCQETAQVEWARNMIRSTNIRPDDTQVWDYRTVKEN